MLPLRSLNSDESAYVQFQNHTRRIVDIVWINYTGDFIKYITLKPGENVNVDTFKTHPWIFVDRQTGLKMRVGLDTIFYPFSSNDVMRRLGLHHEERNIPIRVPIPISLPLFTLRQISVQSVGLLLKDMNDIGNLELPQSLKSDIRRLLMEKRQILSKYE